MIQSVCGSGMGLVPRRNASGKEGRFSRVMQDSNSVVTPMPKTGSPPTALSGMRTSIPFVSGEVHAVRKEGQASSMFLVMAAGLHDALFLMTTVRPNS